MRVLLLSRYADKGRKSSRTSGRCSGDAVAEGMVGRTGRYLSTEGVG